MVGEDGIQSKLSHVGEVAVLCVPDDYLLACSLHVLLVLVCRHVDGMAGSLLASQFRSLGAGVLDTAICS